MPFLKQFFTLAACRLYVERQYIPGSHEQSLDPALLNDVQQRIGRLRPDSERAWGQMPISLMLSHCTAGLQMAMGVINPRPAFFPGSVIGRIIRPLVLATISRCGVTRPPSQNSSRRSQLKTGSTGSETNLPRPSRDSLRWANRAARDIHILSLGRLSHTNGPSSCTNTLTITCRSLVSSWSAAAPRGLVVP